jgi:hypothetical protein
MRDVHGKPVQSKQAEPKAIRVAKDKDNDPEKREDRKAFNEDQTLELHHDRLSRIEEHLGIAHKADGAKAEDQGGKEKVSAGHVTEKGASYGRKRH